MGQDYSYTQPSSSDDYDTTALLQAEADMYADEAESSYNIADAIHYPPQPEADDGIPTRCYCGAEPIVATSYTRKDPGRRYFTCDNVDCHIWKWWNVAIMEEMSDLQTQLRHLKNQANESEQNLLRHLTHQGTESEQNMLRLERRVSDLSKKKAEVSKAFQLVVCLMVLVLFVMFLTGSGTKD